MAKKWSELRVGDKLVAIEDGLDVTKGTIYAVDYVYYDGDISFIDDAGEDHVATSDWKLRSCDEVMPDNKSTLRISVEQAPAVKNEVYPGQVRMDADGFVVLVIYPIFNEDERFNVVLLNDPHNALEPEHSVEFRLNKSTADFTADEVRYEFPFIVDAEIKVTDINEGGR